MIRDKNSMVLSFVPGWKATFRCICHKKVTCFFTEYTYQKVMKDNELSPQMLHTVGENLLRTPYMYTVTSVLLNIPENPFVIRLFSDSLYDEEHQSNTSP